MGQTPLSKDEGKSGQLGGRLRRFRSRSAIAGLIVLVVFCSVAGAVVWRRLATEQRFQSVLTAIANKDIQELQEVARSFPAESARSQLLLGAIDLRTDRPAVALRRLQKAIQDPETALSAQFLAGEALCRLQEYEAGIRLLRGALELDPSNIDGHRWLAVATYDLGAAADAVEQLQHVIRLAPRDPRAHRMLGLIYYEAEEFPDAIAAFQMSLQCSRDQPDLDNLLTDLATSQLRVHRYEDVLTTLRNASEATDLVSLRAEALYALGRGQESRTLVDDVLRTSRNSRALILNGLLLLDEGRPGEAVAPLLDAVESHPEDFEARAKLIQAYSQVGNSDAAKKELMELERIKSIRNEIHNLTLMAIARPDDADSRFRLGLRYRELGVNAVAVKWFRAALALQPAHAAARKEIADCEQSIETSGRR
ncbi:MAG: tetratricopeptide repeat protein [Planctomycetes bacterium]|nr:tetratricopeptide repeat protein [Planctomycetota bacterium]